MKRPMNQGIAVVAALPRELKALVEGWHCEELPENLFVYSNGRVGGGVCRDGLGEQVARAVQAVCAMKPWEVLSVGLAGACDVSVAGGRRDAAGSGD